MPTDQGAPAPTEAYPEGWGFGLNSIKAHYFRANTLTSICGKATSSNSRRRIRPPYTSDCVVCAQRYPDVARANADDSLRVTKLIERSNDREWAYEVRQGGKGYQCQVSVRTAMEQPESMWWANRGNASMARHEAEQWAERQVRSMAAVAFEHADYDELRKP